jgi:uncharacterized protein (TIGR03435 family)
MVDRRIPGKPRTIIAALMMATVCQISGQSPQDPTPAFDVASIKPIAPPYPTQGGPWVVTHGRFKAETAWLRGVIAWAYHVSSAQVKGAPDWINSDAYYFDARSENQEAGPDQVRVMLQSLLAERFKLTVHRDTQQGQVYTLTVGKNGSKLQDAKDGRKNLIGWNGPGRVTFTENQTLQGLVNVLTGVLGAPVVDETGLKGCYNFTLEFTDPRDPRAGHLDAPPDVFGAVDEQLGLHLQSAKRPIDVLIVDHIERPSGN